MTAALLRDRGPELLYLLRVLLPVGAGKGNWPPGCLKIQAQEQIQLESVTRSDSPDLHLDA